MKAGALTRKLIDEIETKYGGVAFNITGASKAGCPDILACIGGKFFAIEVKTTDKLSYLQKAVFNEVIAAGGVADVAHSVEELNFIVTSQKIV